MRFSRDDDYLKYYTVIPIQWNYTNIMNDDTSIAINSK